MEWFIRINDKPFLFIYLQIAGNPYSQIVIIGLGYKQESFYL